jgi:hypothetical protein
VTDSAPQFRHTAIVLPLDAVYIYYLYMNIHESPQVPGANEGKLKKLEADLKSLSEIKKLFFSDTLRIEGANSLAHSQIDRALKDGVISEEKKEELLKDFK